MAERNSNPDLNPQQTKPSIDSLSAQLLALDQVVFNTLSGYYFYTTALLSLTHAGIDLHDERLIMGMTQTGDWLAGQGESILVELARVKRSIEIVEGRV